MAIHIDSELHHQFSPDQTPSRVGRKPATRLIRWGLPAAVLAASTFLAVACGSNGPSGDVKAAVAPTTEVPPATATQQISSSPTAEATPTIQPRPTSTEAPLPTATTPSNPETKKGVSCTFLSDKYCDQGKRIEMTYQDQTLTLVGFKVDPNESIFSLTDSTLFKGKVGGEPFAGSFANIRDPLDPNLASFSIYGDFQYPDGMIPSSKQVTKGEVIATTQNTGVKMFEDYNIVITASIKSPGGSFISDVARLRRLLPGVFNKPVDNKVTQDEPIKPSSTSNYSSSPPPE